MTAPRTSRRRREPRRATMILIGLAGMLVAALLVGIGFNSSNAIPGRSYYVVQAQFRDADNLTAHFQVRMGGELVGQVMHPRVEHGMAVVDLQLDPKVKPLRSDTRAVVRPRSAIGVRYLDLVPGTGGRPLAEGDRIPAAQTAATVALDEALSTLDTPRRRRAQELLTALGAGVAGRGDGLSAGLGRADELAADADGALRAVNARQGAFSRLISAGRDLAVAADPVREQLAQVPGGAAGALRPLGAQAASVRRALTLAPPTLSDVDLGLGRADALLGDLGELSTHLRPALDAAPGALRQTTQLLQTSRPGVRSLRDTLARVQRAVPATVTLLGDVRSVLPPLDTAMGALRPVLTVLAPRGCDIHRTVHDWQDMLDYGVPIKNKMHGGWLNVLRFTVIASAESIGGAGSALGDLQTTGHNRYPAPCEANTEGRP